MRIAFLLPCCLARAAVLRFGDGPPDNVVDLELPPCERWKAVVVQHGADIVQAVVGWKADLDARFKPDVAEKWVLAFREHVPNEYLQELAGMHAELQSFPGGTGLYLSTLLLYQLSHELQEAPRPVGAEVLAANGEGAVWHTSRRDHPVDAKTVMVKFARSGKLVLVGQVELGGIGLVAGMKPREWSFAIRRRDAGAGDLQNGMREDQLFKQLGRLEAGALPMMLMSRRILEESGAYDDVVAMVRAPRLMRAAYISFAGNGPYEGAVISRGANPAFRQIEELNSAGLIDSWYIVESAVEAQMAGISALRKAPTRTFNADFVAAVAAKADGSGGQTSVLVMAPRYARYCSMNNASGQQKMSANCKTVAGIG